MTSPFVVCVDAELIHRAQAGDDLAFKVIYHAFERPAYTLAYRFCQSRDDARDILQDSMLSVFNNLAQFSFQAPFWSWVRRIVVNSALMQLRREHRDDKLEVLVDDVAEVGPDRPAMQRDLAAAFAMLAPTRRAVLWLYAVEGYTHQEIAELMGQTPSFSKSQLMRARRQLKQWWAGEKAARVVPESEENDDRH